MCKTNPDMLYLHGVALQRVVKSIFEDNKFRYLTNYWSLSLLRMNQTTHLRIFFRCESADNKVTSLSSN